MGDGEVAGEPMRWLDDRASRVVYSTDNSIYQLTPERVGIPATSNQIAAALATNHRRVDPRPVVARGGGTGTNGQSLTNGLTIDLKRNLNRLISVDAEAKTAVVEPGLVTGELNELLKPHGLHWAPHTSTLNRATVGGMISTDAAGKGSLVHGRAHRHVKRLVMLLDDGTEWVAEPVTEPEARRRAAESGRGGELWQALLNLDIGDPESLGLPELARGFSGYGVDRFRRDDLVDPVALVCGAEGTLGIVTEATISLTELAQVTTLVVASYPSFGDALDDAVTLRNTGPTAIETLDETTLERGRSSPAWPALGQAVGEHEGAVLLLEYSDVSAADLDSALAAIEATGRSRARKTVTDPSAQASIWKVRADAVGLLARVAVGGPELSARPTAFVEDCAVPVEAMAAFIASFREILDRAGLVYAMFGHADVGCVHVRPALDLTSPAQRELVADITRQVTDLVSEHGGLVWGEHGRGLRGAHVDQVLPPGTVTLMRAVKSAFDPRDIFNPAKLYRPLDSTEPLADVDSVAMRGEIDAEVAVGVRRNFGDAFACNGNGLCHHYSPNEPMCPSYKASGDPALSPRGRADLLRAWLAAPDPDFEVQVAENLDQCLSCSACTGQCPVEVNIPELKSRFLEQFHGRHRRPLSHLVMSRFEELAFLAARSPKLAGLGTKPAGRLLGLVDLPTPASRRPHGAPVFGGETGFDVVIMPDVFTAALEPETLAQAVRVLGSLGYSTAVSRFVASGKFDHVKGKRDRFAQAVDRQRQLVDQITSAGATPVVIEPAVALLHDHEYRNVVAGSQSGGVRPLADMILDRAERLSATRPGASLRLLGHCTERATEPQRARAWARVLEVAGYNVEVPDIGCCGMAGVFGHEVANQEMSRTLWDLSWAAQVRGGSDVEVLATGFSCRSQAKRFGSHRLQHPLHLLATD